MKNVRKPLTILIPLRLTAAKSATVEAVHKKMFGSDNKTLIIYHKEINDIIKIIKSFEESRLLIKGVRAKPKEQKGGFHGMLLGTLGASLLGNLLKGKGTIRAREDTITAGQNFLCHLVL